MEVNPASFHSRSLGLTELGGENGEVTCRSIDGRIKKIDYEVVWHTGSGSEVAILCEL
jgi:hypothetical protein